MLLIVASDPLRPRHPDAHFAPEARAAREAGVEVAVVDHDALTRGDVSRAVSRMTTEGVAVYRGWMLRSEQYAAFADALARRGVSLRTSGEQYRRAHELPGWYPDLAELTPRSAWTVGTERAEFDRARRALGGGAAVLRDFTKSMKHHWHEAAFIPDLDDGDAAWRVASRFLDLRGDDLVGGLVLRRFERFTTAEVRTWWVDGVCVLVGAHPDSPHDTPPEAFDAGPVSGAVAALGLPFVTVDLALRADGVWRIVELGDGQVSDRPSTIDPAALVDVLRRGS
ncbi:ATP-grasp domain-containing protein [Micromonospora sp. DSM 115977]|uniref:ATP-grasp domain-containing protein n=1 Tax=Micromonospora reichwaldensis TaxID=3075516 RepID=A0ABU2WWF3_9ACTN|nr:ATP-grasp domain-containing protein [Micromonospora sp. DSM 115977]MDT0530249.1 ATP-grasp domain-containing protein [Micromonospora sp. DSM 115977]